MLQGLSFRCFEDCIQGMRSLNSVRCVFQSLSLRCLGDCIYGVSSLNSLRVCSLNVQFEVFGGLWSGHEISEVFEGLFPTVRVYHFWDQYTEYVFSELVQSLCSGCEVS